MFYTVEIAHQLFRKAQVIYLFMKYTVSTE